MHAPIDSKYFHALRMLEIHLCEYLDLVDSSYIQLIYET